jgi:hypothetical protein
MEYRKPPMDAKQREERRIEAVRRLGAGESAGVVAASLGLAPNTVYTLGKQAREHRLPSYPIEPMWGHVKGVGLRGYVPGDIDDLHLETASVLAEIAGRQQLLRSFFKATPLRLLGVTT